MTAILKVVGLSLLEQQMDARFNRLKNRETVNAQATVVVDRWIQENFQSGGAKAMGGAGWRPLAPATVALRRKGLGGVPSASVLQDKGDLKKRWKHLWTPRLAKVQSGVDYGQYHEEGTKHLPVRRILPTRDQIRPLLLKLYGKFIDKVLK